MKSKTDEISEIDIQQDEVCNSKDLKEIIDAANTFGRGKKYRNLINVGEFAAPDLKVIKLSCSKTESKYKIAELLLFKRFHKKMLQIFI